FVLVLVFILVEVVVVHVDVEIEIAVGVVGSKDRPDRGIECRGLELLEARPGGAGFAELHEKVVTRSGLAPGVAREEPEPIRESSRTHHPPRTKFRGGWTARSFPQAPPVTQGKKAREIPGSGGSGKGRGRIGPFPRRKRGREGCGP